MSKKLGFMLFSIFFLFIIPFSNAIHTLPPVTVIATPTVYLTSTITENLYRIKETTETLSPITITLTTTTVKTITRTQSPIITTVKKYQSYNGTSRCK